MGVVVSLTCWFGLVGQAAEKPQAEAKAAAVTVAAEAAAGPDVRATRQGQWVRVSTPIDNATVLRVKQTIQRALGATEGKRPVVVLEFDVPSGGGEAGRGTQFEDAQKLARFLVSDELNAATTVAYVPRSLRGHAVLVALACDEIVMAPSATMGDAGVDEKTIDDTIRAAYEQIARSRHSVPVAVALGMLDKSRQVIKVRTEVSTEYVTPAQLRQLALEHSIVSQEPIKAAGEPWQFTGAEGRKEGFVSILADDRRDVVRAMELAPGVVEGDPAGQGGWHAIRLELRGNVTAEKVAQLQRMLDEEIQQGANFVCLWIDSPGGSPVESMALATHLARLDRNRVRTVAYIPSEARSDVAVVAMACDQIIVGPGAVLGGPGASQMSEAEAARFRQTIRDSLARDKMRSWSLWAAMFDPKAAVFRATRLGDVDYFCDAELQSRQPKLERGEKGPPWRRNESVTTPGRVLQLTGQQAAEYRLANAVVDNFAQFKQRYGLDDDPALVEPGWADHLVRFLRSTEIAALLLVVGCLALYIELHAPGIGIGGFVATLCFALFFWSRFLEGTAGWLEVTLFLTGIICLLLELFVIPGVGIFGLGGGVLVLGSLILASQTFWIPRNEYQLAQMEHSMLLVASAFGCAIVIGMLLRRWLPRAPVLQNVFLPPPEGEEAETISRREMLVDLDSLIGAIGVSVTPLSPGGKARFGNHQVDVISAGEFIPRNAQVVVIEVHGNRVVVRAAEGKA